MALNSSGPISLVGTTVGQSIEWELIGSGSTQLGLTDVGPRALAGALSGPVIMPTDFYGKSAVSTIAITTNQTNLNLRSYALANGWNGIFSVIIGIDSGVYVYSTDSSIPGLTIDGIWPNGVTLVNEGFVLGMGGVGGASASSITGAESGGAGGTAIQLAANAVIVNNSYIAGGGGGGAADAAGGGGGAGGGDGGTTTLASIVRAGGAGGNPGEVGGNGVFARSGSPTQVQRATGSGGGGGRILPGVGGAGGAATIALGGGSGGGGGAQQLIVQSATSASAIGGSGGSGGSIGGNSIITLGSNSGGGGGGGWGASGGTSPNSLGIPGVGGKAIELSGFSATISGTGTIYGAVSSNTFGLVISTNTTNLDLRTYALANGWDAVKPVLLIVNPGVYVYSTSISTPGLTITGSFPGGVSVYNQGNIIGMGGNGGWEQYGVADYIAQNAGPAISIGLNVSITNLGYIAGGGGGGAGTTQVNYSYPSGGGGAGGGNGGPPQSSGYGVGGAPGQPGTNGQDNTQADYPDARGGGGGRILPGVGGAGGTVSSLTVGTGGRGGGAGGGGAAFIYFTQIQTCPGAPGGSANNVGGFIPYFIGGNPGSGSGGGGWGAAGGGMVGTGTLYNGGLGGKAIVLNGFTATVSGTGILYGAVS